MNQSDVPSDVRRLLHDCVETYDQLEILNLLAQAQDGGWTAARAADALGVAEPAAAEALAALAGAGVLVETAGPPLRYTAAAEHALVIARLAEAWSSARLEIMNIITANALERLRTSAMRAFASSFLLGKKNG
jgi:hypothetical protein